MAKPESLAVENHHDSGYLSSLLLDDQLEQGEHTSEKVKERHLGNSSIWTTLTLVNIWR